MRVRHCIFIFSDYILGERIGLHLESEDPIFLLKESKKILSSLKNKYSSIKCGIYYVNTEKFGWEEVVRYDKFFEDVKIKNRVNFFRTIKENLYLKEYEEKIINELSSDSYFSGISLLSRKNNLEKDLEELKNLKDLPSFKKALEKEYDELDAKIKNLNLIMVLFNKGRTKTFKNYLHKEIKVYKEKQKNLSNKNLHPIHKLYYTVKLMRLEYESLKKMIPEQNNSKEEIIDSIEKQIKKTKK